jgi:D-alanyl-lipoteichoic acid acyltransferase DltB (MBOAT superfamily)
VSEGKILPSFKEFFSIALTFGLTMIAWIFFRAEDIGHAIHYIQNMLIGLTTKTGYVQTLNLIHWEIGYKILLLLAVFILIEWIGRERQFAIEN